MIKKLLFKKLNLSSFIALDFETTGLSAHSDRIIEIAAIRYIDGKITDRFVTLVNPERHISNIITDLTGITNSMVSTAPKEKEILDKFFTFIGDLPLIAHNISFDMKFLNALGDRFGKSKVDHCQYDTLQLARIFLFDNPAFNLGSIGEYFGLSSTGSHRAEKDAEICGTIFIHLVKEAASYPLHVISKLVSLVKSVTIPNKSLYVDLANELIRTEDLKAGITKSNVQHNKYSNIYRSNGNKHIENISVQDVFCPGGLLQEKMDEFEDRPDQVGYGKFVENIIIDTPEIGIVEAGTGLGKSLAYLFPALKRTVIAGDEGPTIISCHTKHLQDQLFYKDLPLLAQALDVSINAVKLKGRNNYICKTRLNWEITDSGKQLSPREIESLLPIFVWLEYTDTGDLSECNGFWSSHPGRIASLIQSEPGFCTTNICSKYKGCFFGKVRRSVFDAQIIIVNHALLLSEITSSGFLPPYNAVIIDEAHNLISTAYSQLSIHMDQFVITSVFRSIDLSNIGTVWWSKGLKDLSKLYPEFESYYKNLQDQVNEGMEAIKDFFDILSLHYAKRFSVKDTYTKKVIIENLTEEFGSVQGELHWLSSILNNLLQTLDRIERKLLSIDSDKKEYPDLHHTLEQRIDLLKEKSAILVMLTANQNPDWVYWQEGKFIQTGAEGRTLSLSLHGSPIDVSQMLSSQFFEKLDHCILTSATLQIDESFDYFRERVGLNNLKKTQLKTDVFSSPFYYEDQVKYFQYGGEKDIRDDPESIASIIYNFHNSLNNRIMALFTSHKMLNQTYRELRSKPEGRDLPVFAQRYGVSRYSILQGMHSNPNGILLGTNAFWEGIDLPGELLETLIITKLPFSVPTEPVVWAYSKSVDMSGGSSFFDYTVPECVIKFRQGFGRLIRSTLDQGTFIVLDDRVITKGYGKHFSDSIPVHHEVVENINELNF